MDGRPPAEQAVIRAALAAHLLIGPDAPPPEPRPVAVAEQLYQSAQLPSHEVVSGPIDTLAAHQIRQSIQPLYDYLFTTMGASGPPQQHIADLLVKEAESAAEQDQAFRPWLPVTLLIKAAHYTHGGRAFEALQSVDQTVERLRKLRGDPAIRDGVHAAAQDARRGLAAAIAQQPMSEQRCKELDDTSYDFDRQGRELCVRDDLDRARECFDQAMAAAEAWHAAFPNDARAIRAVASTSGNRLMCLTEAEEFEAAVPDGIRALSLFESLRSPLYIAPFEVEAAEVQVRLALAVAGAALDGGSEVAGADPLGSVTTHGTAGIEACRRIGGHGDHEVSGLGRMLALYARAQRLLADDGLVPEDVARQAEAEALEFGRRHVQQFDVSGRRYFADVALSHALSQLDENHAAASAAAADYLEQSLQLLSVGLPVHRGADRGQVIEEAGYAEYIIARSKLALGDASFGQHLVNAQHLLDQHPGPLPAPIARVKGEIDEFIARWRQEEADRSA